MVLLPLVYFSSSNNTAYVARLIAIGLEEKGLQTELVPIEDLKTKKRDLQNAEVIGVGAPIYGGFAEPIKDWVKTSDFSRKRVFLFSTAGIWQFGSTAEMIRLVEKNNGEVIGAFEMTFRGCMDGIVYSKRLSESHPLTKADIQRAVDFGCRIADAAKTSGEFVDGTKKHHFSTALTMLIKGVKFIGLKLIKICFYTIDSDKCVGCMKCTQACPTGAVVVSDKSPKISHRLCISCFRCFKECPQGALSLRFVGDRPYYRGPWQLKGYIDPSEIRNQAETLLDSHCLQRNHH
jgi:ferredoxin/flavodoxin